MCQKIVAMRRITASDWLRLTMLKENLGLRPRPIGFRIAGAYFRGSQYDGMGGSPWLGGPCIMCTNENGGGIRSFHPGGTHVVMCDGTVHFLSENIAQRTFGYMITRDKGEPLSQFTNP